MTAFELAKANSTIETGTFFEHLQNPSGTGGSADNIDDDGGFMILGTQIIYYDINGVESSRFDMKDAEGVATDTYIMSKMLNSNVSSGSTIDKRGGSKIVANQQIDYSLAGVESARYNLFDINGDPTMSEIFLKELVV